MKSVAAILIVAFFNLFLAIQANGQDHKRVITLNQQASAYLKAGKADSAQTLATDALELAQRLNYPTGEADAYLLKGKAFSAKSNTKEALPNYVSAANLYGKQTRNNELAEASYLAGSIYQRTNYDEALFHLKRGLSAAEKTTTKEFGGKCAYMIAVVNIRKSKFDEAAVYKNLALKYYSVSGTENDIANCYVVSSRINKQHGNIPQAVKDNYTALKLFEKTGNKVGEYNVYTGLGLIYEDQKNWKEALNSYLAAKKAAEENGGKEVKASAYNNLGNAYRELGRHDEALDVFQKGLTLAEEAGDKKAVASSVGNIGTIYSLKGNKEEALKRFEQARKVFEEIGSKESTAIAYLETGKVYYEVGKLTESKTALESAINIADKIDRKDVLSDSYKLLSQIDTTNKNYASALTNYRLYISNRDSISNAEAARQLSEQRLQYAFSKKEDSLRLEQALIAEQLEKQTVLTRQQQQELKLKQTSLELAKRENDLQMLQFLQTKTQLQLTNEQNERQLAQTRQEKALQESELEKQTLQTKQKEQELLLKDRKLQVQRSRQYLWLGGALGLLVFSFFMYKNYRQKKRANQLLQQQNIELEDQRDQVKKAMAELQETQIQLIHKEKMATLGELTAGIAHEIQNPLNFVNNFSEVSVELGNELKQAVANTSLPTEQQHNLHSISDELLQNQERISHHGKRAGAIVKNMLQHSRKIDSRKELTDINKLVQECINLSYHGFHNKDESFSSRVETDFDMELPRIEIAAQDIGRVILNLLNNAFYAVNERKRTTDPNKPEFYEPHVLVNTRHQDGKVFIVIKDNGHGIPEDVAAKVFQPFFTTKPTGEGTGLGLSLSYDVITKGHRGDIKLKTSPGEGAEFTIELQA